MSPKEESYIELLAQLKAILKNEKDSLVRQVHTIAMLQETFNFLWTGFYFVETNDTLVVGPYQGTLACTRIKKGKGVCGTSWKEDKTIIVPNVELFSGHIACSSLSRSEIVIPVHDESGKVSAVLDIDSQNLNQFDEIDARWLEKIVRFVSEES